MWEFPKGQIRGELSHHNLVIMLMINDSYKDGVIMKVLMVQFREKKCGVKFYQYDYNDFFK